MIKCMYGTMLALMMVVPVHGMRRSFEPVPEQSKIAAQERPVVPLLDDLWMHIFAQSNPTLRNAWMKTCRNFHLWASPRNLLNLAKEGAAQLSMLDSFKGVLHYLQERNFEMVRYFFAPATKYTIPAINSAIAVQIFGVETDDDFDRYKKLLPKGEALDSLERLLKAHSHRNRAELKGADTFMDLIMRYPDTAWKTALDSYNLKKWTSNDMSILFRVAI